MLSSFVDSFSARALNDDAAQIQGIWYFDLGISDGELGKGDWRLSTIAQSQSASNPNPETMSPISMSIVNGHSITLHCISH